MQIQISTDHNIECHEALDSRVRGVVETALSRNSDHITRVEIHMSDKSSNKKGGIEGMRCVMEVRLERYQPIAVTHRAETLDHAVHAAADKLTRLIDHTIGRMRDHRAHGHVPPSQRPEDSEDAEE